MEKLGERIKIIRKLLGFNQTELALKLGLKTAVAVSHYEANQREPDINMLVILSRLGNVDLNWLLTGEGDMKRGERGERPQVAAEPAAAYNVRDIEMQEIVGFLKENPVDKKVILKLIKSKKMAKEALEEFAGLKGLVGEG